MSSGQYISGNMSQVYHNEHGEFITILDTVRVRKQEIMAYRLAGPITSEDKDCPIIGLYSVNFMISSGWNASEPCSKEECEAELKRIDAIYAKDYGKRGLEAVNES